MWYLSIVIYALLVIFVITYIINRLTCGYSSSPVCLVGKTAIVTGGNSGIGYQVCLMLASRGCKVIIADIANTDKSRKNIIEATDNPNVYSKYLNVGSFKSIREFAEDINATVDKLDILINNAGLGGHPIMRSDDGLNNVMQINHFGPFLLSHLLLDLLKKSAPSRIVNTSSILAFANNLTKENVNDCSYDHTGFYQPLLIYGNSKLCTLITSNEMGTRLRGTGVTCNSVHPGLVRTEFGNTMARAGGRHITNFFAKIWNLVAAKSAWEGAQTTFHAAIDKKYFDITSSYLGDCRQMLRMPSQAYDKDFCKYIWKVSEDLCQLKENEKIRRIENV